MRTSRSISGLALGPEGARPVARSLPEEAPVAITCNGSTQAVMMATPARLRDFAMGFALTEGLAAPDQIQSIEVLAFGRGVEVRLWIDADRAERLADRRRSMLGPTGCGLCGIESLDQALRPLPTLPDAGAIARSDLQRAAAALRAHQPLHDLTRAVHAAGFWRPGRGIVLAREDVGRHNALDKLIGAMMRARLDPASGAIVLTSRVSVEMVQKTVLAGCPVLVAVSAPTTTALRLAEGAGLTVAAFANGPRIEVFSHARRILTEDSDAA